MPTVFKSDQLMPLGDNGPFEILGDGEEMGVVMAAEEDFHGCERRRMRLGDKGALSLQPASSPDDDENPLNDFLFFLVISNK